MGEHDGCIQHKHLAELTLTLHSGTAQVWSFKWDQSAALLTLSYTLTSSAWLACIDEYFCADFDANLFYLLASVVWSQIVKKKVCHPVTFNFRFNRFHENENLELSPRLLNLGITASFGVGYECTWRKAWNIQSLSSIAGTSTKYGNMDQGILLSDCLLFSHCSCVIK